MNARLGFEWNGEKAKDLINVISVANLLGSGNDDIVNRDDADYEVSLIVKLQHKRKSRRKVTEPENGE